MKLSADKASLDYHDVVLFVDMVLCDGEKLKNCVWLDLTRNEAVCMDEPLKVDKDGVLTTHIVTGKLDLIWRKGGVVFHHLKKDWEEREKLREQAKHSTAITVGDAMGIAGYENVMLHKGNVNGPR